jgi:hypothetical protein
VSIAFSEQSALPWLRYQFQLWLFGSVKHGGRGRGNVFPWTKVNADFTIILTATASNGLSNLNYAGAGFSTPQQRLASDRAYPWFMLVLDRRRANMDIEPAARGASIMPDRGDNPGLSKRGFNSFGFFSSFHVCSYSTVN